jgi:hypothetical protein
VDIHPDKRIEVVQGRTAQQAAEKAKAEAQKEEAKSENADVVG